MEKKKGANFFGVLATIVFLLSLLSAGGVFAYKKIVENQIVALGGEIQTAEGSLDKAGIENLSNFDKRIKAIKTLIHDHVAVSGYLKMLEASTVSNIEFKSLKYSAPAAKGQISITMDGRAGSYAAVAEEEAILLKNPDTISATFDNLSLNKDSGGVSFVLKGSFKGKLVNFSELMPKI